jgi:hypothetical protein
MTANDKEKLIQLNNLERIIKQMQWFETVNKADIPFIAQTLKVFLEGAKNEIKKRD